MGEVTYLDVLLSSENIVDFVSNYFIVTELAGYNVQLLEGIEKQRVEIENTKIFISPGNHDPYLKKSYYSTFNCRL